MLWETALALSRAAPAVKPLSPLLFVTDPDRAPEPWRAAARLPRGAGVVFRAFGAADAVVQARRLRSVCEERGLRLLIGRDDALALACGADGLHLPTADLARGPALRAAHPDWVLTGAAHSAADLQAAEAAGLDAVLLSPVFPSASPSAGEPLGLERFETLAGSARLPVYALGGVDAATAPRLLGGRASGIAGVEGVLKAFGMDGR